MKENNRNDNQKYEETPLQGVRKAIATAMVNSKSPIPHFYLTIETDMDNIIFIRKKLNNSQNDIKISYNDIIIKIVANCLKKFPYMRTHLIDGTLRTYNFINIGFAVSTDFGLLVPVIKDCDKKNIFQIAKETKEFVEKSRNKKLRIHEREGAVFTISNLGMYEIENFSAIINPPQSSILSVGTITKKPVVINDKIEIKHRMKLTLSCDHRVIDGAQGATFLMDLKRNIENPAEVIKIN
ncbi:MAG: 2-oxo acid dehydrogenase subunit E2 [Candidatus Marinimicrobia bacterium]|nr:2-oxo acid dehydrogenase subunit E2 [Candidatus Neomarinimicrobiota bacterium]